MDSNQRITTVFITGISASGKSTLGKSLYDRLINHGIENIKLLDGDELRHQFERRGMKIGYSTEERCTFALEIGKIAKEYNDQGYHCIICSIVHVKKIRLEIRNMVNSFVEVFLKCPVEECAKRDYKGNYKKALNGEYDNFIGVTESYQESDQVELILETAIMTIQECIDLLTEDIIGRLTHNEYNFRAITRTV